jgi:serine protease Do
MTLGVVSNNERTFYPDRQKIDEYETGEFSNWIQMDTPIAPGNSGGPLVDIGGKVVGINTRGIQGQGLNFAIPIDTAKPVLDEILQSASPERKGRVERSDIGVEFKPLQDLETFYDIDINKGALVTNVDRGSPAAQAGIRAQDILLTINGQPVNARFPEEIAAVRRMISDVPVGSELLVQVKRGKETISFTLKTVRLESAVGEERELKTWGLSVRDVTRAYANEQRLDDDTGVLVTTTSAGYPAAKGGLDRGDVIRAVNGQSVTDLEEFMRLYDASIKNKDERILLDTSRGRGRRSAVLKVTY